MTDEELVVLTIGDDGVAMIEINRPDKRNALSVAAQEGLLAAFDACRRKAKVVVLTGRGTAFCSGTDLKERAELDKHTPEPPPAQGGGMHSWIKIQDEIRHHPSIFIAAVNGYALGGGMTLVNTCDLAIAAEEAVFGMPELGFGMYPAMSGTSSQVRLLHKHAAWMVLTTDRIDAHKAVEWGLVNQVVPLAELLDTARELAARIASFDAVALEWTKKALWEVPMRIPDYTQALEYGDHVALQIRTATTATAKGLEAFGKGERTAGQGA